MSCGGDNGSGSHVIDDLIRFLISSGCVSQSVERLRPELPRWERWLQKRGHAAVPDLRNARWWTWAEIRAGNDVNLLMNQAAGNQPMGHMLRNLTGVRRYKI